MDATTAEVLTELEGKEAHFFLMVRETQEDLATCTGGFTTQELASHTGRTYHADAYSWYIVRGVVVEHTFS